jgi:hypothetical protein
VQILTTVLVRARGAHCELRCGGFAADRVRAVSRRAGAAARRRIEGRGSEWVGRRGAAVCGCGRCGAGQRHGAAAVDHCVVCEAGVLVRVVPGCY